MIHKKFMHWGLQVTSASFLATTFCDMRMLSSIQDVDRRTLLLLQQSQSCFALHSRTISRSADGHLYALLGGLFAAVASQGAAFLVHGLLAFAAERASYWVLKNSLRRKRPAQALPGFRSHIIASDEFSFPSGHTSAAFLFATIVVLHFGPVFLPLYCWSASVAMSRIYLGVHFPTDTVMGALLGTGIAYSTLVWVA